MSTLEQIYKQAVDRAAQNSLTYAGAFAPAEAFELLQLDPRVRLIDVRTRAELDWVGRPAIDQVQYSHVEWIRYPGPVPNDEFIQQIRQVATPDTPVLFLCRSAARSKLAAVVAQKEGFEQAYDLLEGFEGDKDAQGHRKTVSGWCFRGLPWVGV
ncbi:Rhodanese-related sulfurtransferase [Candidatus Burkholderia brachyanthoides]|nr:Rhodanese-related sulfurtransferase [Candidatus Burkholderia brachyanthoides]